MTDTQLLLLFMSSFVPRDLYSLIVCCIVHRLPTSVAGVTASEFGRISFVFETICTADCELYFMMVSEWCDLVSVYIVIYGLRIPCALCTWIVFLLQDVNRKSTNVVESWEGTKSRRAYTHIMTKNASVSYTWAFQRTNKPLDVRIKPTHRL